MQPVDLICLKCGNDLQREIESESDNFVCKHCSEVYPVINDIPIIIDEETSLFSKSDFILKKNLFFDLSSTGKGLRTLGKFVPSSSSNWGTRKNLKTVQERLFSVSGKPKVLVIGGSIVGKGMNEFLNKINLEIIESDVSFGPRTDIILDCHKIPFKDEYFDGIIVQAVLEHVAIPTQCVKEIHRVLKFNGIIYAETPFMQQVHGGPYDFTRFTMSGHRLLFKEFQEIQSGLTAGPGTAMLWSYEYLLLSIFGFNRIFEILIKGFARFSGFWLKYLDLLTNIKKFKVEGASGLYFIGIKGKKHFQVKDLVDYYYKSTGSSK